MHAHELCIFHVTPRGIGHELLSILLHFIRKILSTLDPVSKAALFPTFDYLSRFTENKKYFIFFNEVFFALVTPRGIEPRFAE